MEEGLGNGEQMELKFKKELIEIEIPRLNKESKSLEESLSTQLFEKTDTDIDVAC